jgi:hypothetical protein
LISAANKGFWGELLGVGDFYYELGIEIIEICIRFAITIVSASIALNHCIAELDRETED